MAIDALKQATELDPDLAEAHFKLGVAYALEESADDTSAEPEKIDPEATPTPKPKGNKKSGLILKLLTLAVLPISATYLSI